MLCFPGFNGKTRWRDGCVGLREVEFEMEKTWWGRGLIQEMVGLGGLLVRCCIKIPTINNVGVIHTDLDVVVEFKFPISLDV